MTGGKTDDLFSKVKQNYGPGDLVILNIKEAAKGTIFEITDNELISSVTNPLLASLYLFKNSHRILRPGSTIIITGGGFKDHPNPQKASLSISKAALYSFFLVSREEVYSKIGMKLKTLIIDGKVEDSPGRINPQDVALAFLKLYQNKDLEELTIR